MGTVGDAPPFARVFIAGCGLVGGSLGLVVKALWPEVDVRVLDPAAPAAVRQHFALATSAADAVWADLVVLGAPVGQNGPLLGALAPHVRADAVVTDVGSTKRDIVEVARRVRLLGTFVGGHPMAGSAHSGFAHATPGLFAARPWILTPDTDGAAAASQVGPALARLTQMVCAIGARPVVMSAEEHDRLVAYISHMPQLVSSAVMAAAGRAVQRDGLQFSGPGLMDVTRLAASAPALWHDILTANADFIGEAMRAVTAALPKVATTEEVPVAGDAVLKDGRHWRQVLEGATHTHGAGARRVLHRPAVRTYLEMTSPDALRPAAWPHDDVVLRRLDAPPPSLYRYLYREVGRPWHWLDRWDWSDRRIAEHLESAGIELWLLTEHGVPSGFFELHRTVQETEIAYFGLLPECTGRGLGRALLTQAAIEAWRTEPGRVWLHTCSLDHPAALRNYQARGFVVYREEPYDARIPLDHA
jgi:prephenate dehydrogenase/GNAT superfamily N-acetyltransferase